MHTPEWGTTPTPARKNTIMLDRRNLLKNVLVFPVLTAGLFLGMIKPSSAGAQVIQGGLAPTLPSASAASYYYISKPGELTMQVNVWGSVRNPGRYEVGSTTDLIQLISYAGGPAADAKLDEVQITRFQMSNGLRSISQYSVDLDHLATVDSSKLVLYPGDTIFIDRSGWTAFRDVLTVVTTAAIITSAVANVIIASNRGW